MTKKLMLGMLLSVFNATAGAVSDTPVAWLETTSEQGRLYVNAYVKTSRISKLEYSLISIKSGSSGNATTKQAGSVDVEADKTYPLTKLRLGYNAGDKYTITLSVYENAVLVAQEKFTYP